MARGTHQRRSSIRRRAFSLVEMLMVISIMGMLSAIAVPRISRAATASLTSALQGTLAGVRSAVDMYYAEHGKYPGYQPSNDGPSGDWFVKQLTTYSNEKGDTSTTYGYPYILGPYLRSPFPANPLNGLATVHVKPNPTAPDPPDGSVGWIAVLSHGYFGVSATTEQLNKLEFSVSLQALVFGGGA
jgi:prepilin-type N-terminal cleavage/methylation domain-containing protein